MRTVVSNLRPLPLVIEGGEGAGLLGSIAPLHRRQRPPSPAAAQPAGRHRFHGQGHMTSLLRCCVDDATVGRPASGPPSPERRPTRAPRPDPGPHGSHPALWMATRQLAMSPNEPLCCAGTFAARDGSGRARPGGNAATARGPRPAPGSRTRADSRTRERTRSDMGGDTKHDMTPTGPCQPHTAKPQTRERRARTGPDRAAVQSAIDRRAAGNRIMTSAMHGPTPGGTFRGSDYRGGLPSHPPHTHTHRAQPTHNLTKMA